MDIFENPGNRFRRLFPYLSPVLFAALLCTLFYVGISHMQTDSLEKEQTTLTQALEGGAIRTYALTGQYPQSLSELLTDYHITYAPEDVNLICNQEKTVPLDWITGNGSDIGQQFIDYALPLIQGSVKVPEEGGLPKFAYRKCNCSEPSKIS